ncbi:MAG TPA: peptide chain release factor N(5)-glutamine methyltransferase [Marmoricola sp.]|nr:peptide chain release factor N(5)-glutamine methyltransferase [Marmoricola sp.]HMY08225.1 peptide chain release factor N(5)-glutamine methyltransferase [Marmoricola sp.]
MTDATELIRQAANRLRQAGVASPEYDARALLAHVLVVPLGQLALVDQVEDADRARFEELISDRAARVPLQHLTGVAHFRQISVAVGPGVFIPRPETELLAGWAIERAAECESPMVVDLCSGSGVIAKAIADELPGAEIHAVELDLEAFSWCQRNLADTGVIAHQGDMSEALAHLDGQVDVVVCNPPYVPLSAFDGVDEEARRHDPAVALFSGDDGLEAMRALERRAATLLRPGGWLGAEHADLQGEFAPAVFAQTGCWDQVRDHQDLAGRPRFVTARLAR